MTEQRKLAAVMFTDIVGYTTLMSKDEQKALALLKKNRELTSPARLWETLTLMASMTRHVGPFMLRALLPGHNPRCDEDPQWMRDWIAGYAALPQGALIPLLDTAHPDVPVPNFDLEAEHHG